eukprot:GDKI01021574.1.p1 GENE.GDKI01021574.1~~GDKI01021574.1.p1  ORF type:complete len:411 (-),score=122.40 GDKI01021574.1:54-1181(-)
MYVPSSISPSNKSRIVDLRSDTVTKPTPEMRQAMFECEVGDDVLDEDPTIHQLQQTAAAMCKKEAALFVPSGTMGNLISVAAHCELRDSECLLGEFCHIHIWEQGGISTLAGVHPRTVKTLPNGELCLSDLQSKVRGDNCHYPVSRVVCLENTQNYCGGRVLKLEYIQKVAEFCKKNGLKLHLDGARVFNAATALNVEVHEIAQHFDSVSICLSKGLAAPVGSVIVGTKEFIKKCVRLRKALGGGMRQAGVLAACGLISLNVMSKRLHEDHTNAKRLAEGIHGLKLAGLPVDIIPEEVESNIVVFRTPGIEPKDVCERLGAGGGEGCVRVLTMPFGLNGVRMVTHYQISEEDVTLAIAKLRSVLETFAAQTNGKH